MQFGEPEVLADGCVLLRPTLGTEQYQHLRQSILGSSAKHHGAHITLLHPRNTAGASYNVEELAHSLGSLAVTFRTISLIEQHGIDPWRVRRDHGVNLQDPVGLWSAGPRNPSARYLIPSNLGPYNG